MGYSKSKPLSLLVFIPVVLLLFIRPFFSGLTYPSLEIYYQNSVIFFAIIALFFSTRSKNNTSIVQANPQQAEKSRTNPYNIPLLLLLCAYLTSTITSVNLQNSIKEIIKFISYLSIFFLVSQTNDGQKKIIIKTIVITASIISVYSIYQYFWGYQHTLNYLKKINSNLLLHSSYAKDILIAKRAIGTFPSPNLFGGYLIIAFFPALYLLFEQIRHREKSRELLISLLPLIVITFALIFTKSMGVWLCLLFSLIILFLTYTPLRQRKLIITFSLVFIALIITFIVINRWERLMNLENPQNSITQRLSYWRTAIAMIKDHPIVGVGSGNFQEVFLKYKTGMSTDTRYAHNIFLHQWAETGMLGIIALLYLIMLFLKKIKLENKNIFIFLGGVTFILHNLIDNTYFIPQAGLFFWILLGLL